ncbi:MAG: glutamyl-tRNA reductase [Legionellales bacterium]|nr:glutamyl-tRNA reductase [Legionellales bacterium]
MVFVACGLNHKTAPLSVREKVAPQEAKQDSRLYQLMALPEVHEATILSTCNRTEIYCDTEDPSHLAPWLAHVHHLSTEDLSPYFYMHQGDSGVRHTLRVASGLDSMMLGEPQILGQMKQAYLQGCRLGTLKNNLKSVFQYVFSATKRIRHQSGIGNNPISIAFAAVRLVGQIFPDFSALKVFIIGSGETASLVAKYLAKEGVHQFLIASRSHDNAQSLAHQFSARALTIGDIPQGLSQADVIISATSCPLPFINKGMVEQALSQRNMAQMFFLDLAVPRDIEPNVSEIEGVHLYNIDDLQKVTALGMNKRRQAAEQAEGMIELELDNYIRWHRSLKARDVICDYRRQMKVLAQSEIQRAMQKLSAGHCQYNVLEEFGERLLNKLTHTPTIGLKRAARNNREELLDFAQFLLEHSPYEKIT